MATEPTALAVMARTAHPDLLLSTRRSDGSWIAVETGQHNPAASSWCTSLALMASLQAAQGSADLGKTVAWLCRSRGIESHWLWRWKFRFFDTQVSFDPEKTGWSWVPETTSWVVPTAATIVALRIARSKKLMHPELDARLRLGVEMLIDRACPTGGWNAGNASVFGVPLDPHVDATATALIALRAAGHEPEPTVTKALNQLLIRTKECTGAESLAWTVLALHAWRRHGAIFRELRDRGKQLRRLMGDPRQIANNSTLALGAIAIDALQNDHNPFEVQA